MMESQSHDLRQSLASLHESLERFFTPIVIIAALASVPLTVLEEKGGLGADLSGADWLIWGVFAVEFVSLLATAPDRRRFVKGHWLSLLIVVVSCPLLPALAGLLRLGRLVRIVRLFRLVRMVGLLSIALPALGRVLGRSGLLHLASLTVVLIFGGGALMSILEPGTVKGDFWSGVWWAIVTTTTVGYGDISPTTLAGRLVATVLMFTGIGLTATLAASVAAHFVGQEQGAEQKQLEARLEHMEALLEQLNQQRHGTDERPTQP